MSCQDDIDLDINNYDLKDIISLFHIKFDFDKSDLRKAKRIVLSMHPDKSGLDKEYFLFFTSAYKLLYSIYEFRYKSQERKFDPSEVYVAEKDVYKEELLKEVKNRYNDSKSFNVWFNELFEKAKINDEDNDNGYDDWFRSTSRDDNQDDNDNENEKISQSQMHQKFEEKKSRMRTLVKKEDICEVNAHGSNQYDLTRDKPEYYSSDIFGKLAYNDLKKAHTETLIPVTEEDYLNTRKFNNANELKNHRSDQDITPLSLAKAREHFKNNKGIESQKDIERAYKLAKQDEEAQKANDSWWASIKALRN